MPLHPQAESFLEQYRALGVKRTELCTPDEIRANMLAGIVRAPDRFPMASTVDRRVNTEGTDIAIRVYRASTESGRPVMAFFHGGGWVAGNIETHDLLCRAIADAAGAVVVSVDYRLAPEHKFPTAAEDCYAALKWTFEHVHEYGGDPDRIAVAGDSAGGNLAAAVPIMARDRGHAVPWQQILIYPITDARMATQSYTRFAEGHLLTRSAMEFFWGQYTARPSDRSHPYVAPLMADDLSGLPAALVLTAECDVLCDEGEAYARRLADAGVPAEVVRYDGMLHGFAHRLTIFDSAQLLVRKIADTLNRTLP